MKRRPVQAKSAPKPELAPLKPTVSPLRTWPSRFARSLFGGALASLAVAGIDSAIAHSRLVDQSRSPGWLNLVLAEIGLVAPATLAAAGLFACLALLTHPRQPPSWTRLRQWLNPETERTRLVRGIVVPLVIVGAAAWIVSSANLSRTLLSRTEQARASGAAIGAASLSIALLVGALVVALSASAIRFVGTRTATIAKIQPRLTVPLGLVVFALILGVGIATGTTSGDGGLFGIFGVLKRPELDLKAPGLLLLAGLGAYVSGAWPRRLWAPLAVVLALAPLSLTARAAKALDDDTRSGALIEGQAPLGRVCLRLERKLTDRDRDGASRFFGGGDCNDRDPEINPMASDVPNNGIDEDCSGADLQVQAAAPTQTAPQQPTPTSARSKIPADINVLLISIDTLRWDVGYAGYERPTTPSLDKLAAKSTVFDTFYALATYTGKSIGPLMSGKYPSETNRGWSHYNTYPKPDRMVQERLKAAGVRTIAVHSHWYFKGWSGLGRGFDVLDMTAAPPGGVDATEDATTAADRLSDSAIRVLSKPENTSKRFFAWVHYFDPHAEYVHHKGTTEFGNKMRDKYDHEVRFTDDQVGRLLDFVNSQPWAANTAILVTSDHGEAFSEHGMIRHGFEVWEELCRVPFLIYVPGLPPKHIKPRRSAIDMVPTILDLLQVQLESPKDKFDFISGVSLLPEVLLPENQQPPVRDVLVDMPAGPNNDERRAFIRGDKKLTISNGVRYQLFDLAQDPGEKNDLAEDKAMLKAARAEYDAFRVKLREVKVKRPEDE